MFCIPERPRKSVCFRAKVRPMRVIFGKKINKRGETAAGLPENEEKLKGLRFWWATNLLAGLRNHCFEQQKENQFFVTVKNNQRKQKLTERVSW